MKSIPPIVKAMMLGLLLMISIAPLYNNCSQVDFGVAENASFLNNNEQLNGGNGVPEPNLPKGLVEINYGAQFTKNKIVQLRLESEQPIEMYITHSPGCESGGTWEPFASERQWTLDSENQSVAVYARFKLSEGGISECVTDSILHDNRPPNLNFSAKPAAFEAEVKAHFGLEGSDENGSGIQNLICDVNGDPASCSLGSFALTANEGTSYIAIWAVDKAGNVSAPIDYYWLVDLTPPKVFLNLQPPSLTSATTADFSFSVDDGSGSGIATLECTLDNNTKPCHSSSQMSYSALAEGDHSFSVTATDQVGRKAKQDYSWTINLSAPTLWISQAPAAITNQTVGNFSFDGQDRFGKALKSFECKLDSGAIETCDNKSRSYTSLSQGIHQFWVRGIDQSDLASTLSYSWIVDLTPATLAWVKKPDPITNNTSETLLFEVTDAVGLKSVECQLDGGAFKDCSNKVFTASALIDGTHNVMVRATDKAGNLSSISTSWQVDTQKPKIDSLLASETSPTNKNAITLSYTGSDNAGGSGLAQFQCALDNPTQISTCPISPQTQSKSYDNLPDGTHLFFIKAIDNAQNSSDITSISWKIDTRPPTLIWSQRPSDQEVQLASVFEFSVTDPDPNGDPGSGVKSVQCTLDDAPVTGCSEQTLLSFSNLPAGTHTFKIIAEDLVGNLLTVTHSWVLMNGFQSVTQSVTISKVNNKVDILMVVDNSGSMTPEQKNMYDRIKSFASTIMDLDWQMAVITTDPRSATTGGDGQLYPFRIDGKLSSTYVLSKTYSTDLNVISNIIGSTIQMGSDGSGNEQGIYNTYRSIERIKTDPSRNGAFYRTDAALAVVIISDENESASNFKNEPANLISLVKNTFGQKSFSAYSIVAKSDDPLCKNSSPDHKYGVYYENLSKLTGVGDFIGSVCTCSDLQGIKPGISPPACQTDYSSQLTQIGKLVKNQTMSLTLNCIAQDANGNGQIADDELKISSNGNVPNFSVSGNRVDFASPLDEGATYDLSYLCLK